MTIGRRIVLGFAAALALTFVLGAIGFYSLGRASRSYDQSLDTETQVRNPAFEALLAVRGANVHYLRFLLEEDARYIAQRDSSIAVADSLLRHLRARSTDEQMRTGWETTESLVGQWAAAGDSSLAALAAGDRAEALRVRAERVQPLRARLDEEVERALALAGGARPPSRRRRDRPRGRTGSGC